MQKEIIVGFIILLTLTMVIISPVYGQLGENMTGLINNFITKQEIPTYEIPEKIIQEQTPKAPKNTKEETFNKLIQTVEENKQRDEEYKKQVERTKHLQGIDFFAMSTENTRLEEQIDELKSICEITNRTKISVETSNLEGTSASESTKIDEETLTLNTLLKEEKHLCKC